MKNTMTRNSLRCAAFMGGQGARARTIAYRSDGTVPTLKSSPSGTNTVPDVVYCFEPGIAKREGSDSRFVQDRCVTLRAEMGDNQLAICFQQNQRKAGCTTRTMCAMRRQTNNMMKIYNESGKGYWMEGFGCIRTEGENRPSRPGHVVCYAIEGNVVDRVSNKNGKGWCEDVSPTLNTQDRHAVVFALEGNGARPSHQGKGFSDDGTMYTLNTIEQHSVCYGISRSALKGGEGANGGMPIEEDLMPGIVAQGTGGICYRKEQDE